MLLYHFPTSPFARRIRLALAHKGLTAELRDARAVPEHAAEVRRLNPARTIPVLVDGERVVTGSGPIAHYLEAKVPSPSLFPSGLDGAEAYELVAMADMALEWLVDLGTRCAALHDHPRFPEVRSELVGRAQALLDGLGERVAARSRAPGAPLFDAWSYADMTLVTMVVWLEGLPARAPTFPAAKAILELGWTIPPALRTWADAHRTRADVAALG